MNNLPDSLRAALAGRYELERELGAGGMATVYLARDERESRRVALKVLLPELTATVGAERFLREIQIGAGLQHPHIVPLYGSGESDGFLYYAMAYVEGESLRARLDREGQLPVEEALAITREVASALSYAHEHDVVHRDIKPENIMLSPGGTVVMDFGIAKALDTAGGEKLTETGLAMGTPAYMSPEQAEGRAHLDGRSDQYALACVLYEMLAGHPPFQGPSAAVVLSRAAKDPAPPVSSARPTVSAPVEAVLHKALSKVPADRFPSAEKFAEALEMAEQGVTPRGVTPSGVAAVSATPASPTPAGLTPAGLTPAGIGGRPISMWTELARRRVYQVAASYAVVAWALVQLADAVAAPLGLPAQAHTWLVRAAIGGLPVALLLSWLYDLTPNGIRRTQAIDVTPVTGTLARGGPRLAPTLGVLAIGFLGAVAYTVGRSASGPVTDGEIAPFPPGTNRYATAVIPFRVSTGLESYRTSIVDLLLPRLNHHGIELDPAVIRTAWRRLAGADTADVDAFTARRIAREVVAPWLVQGSLTATPGGLTISASRVWVETGETFGTATIETSEDSLNRALAMLPPRLLHGDPQRILDETPTEALDAYSAGVTAKPDFSQAIPNFERALEFDPTFGPAAYQLFYASSHDGRSGPALESARAQAWALRDRMAAHDSLYLLVDGNFGPRGPEHRPYSPQELFGSLEEITTDPNAPWEIWSVYMIRTFVWRDLLDISDWRGRAIRAANRTIEGMPPTEDISNWVRETRYELALEAPERYGESVRAWGRNWAENAGGVRAPWMFSAYWGDWDAVGEILSGLHDADMLGGQANEWRVVDRFVDESALRGYPLDRGAEQAVAAAGRQVASEDDRRVVVHARARLALLQGRLREAAMRYDTLRAIGNTSWRWMGRRAGAYAALADPTLRKTDVDFGAPYLTADPDTASSPELYSNDDNPNNRLCIRDLWETAVMGDVSRPSKTRAGLDTLVWRNAPGISALEAYEQGACEAIAKAVIDEAGAGGDLPSPGLLDLEARALGTVNVSKLVRLFAARLLADRGLYDRALKALGPFPDWWNDYYFYEFVPVVLPHLVLEGRLAAKVGDVERATKAFKHYLTLRTQPDDLARPEADAVCAELRELAGGDAAEEFDTCR